MNNFKLGKKSRENLEGVNPLLIQVIEQALKFSTVDFGIPSTGGFRTQEEQKRLYLANKSMLDGLHSISKHQTGNAFDIFAYVDGKANYEIENLTKCATAILQAAIILDVKLIWGGLWTTFKDMPHFEIKDEDKMKTIHQSSKGKVSMINYAEMVKQLAKTGQDISNEMTAEKAHLIHMVMGIAGEAGELLDAVKKSVIYNKPLDLVNVIEELGDIEFYMEGLRQQLLIDRKETLASNMEKLGKRYKGHRYTDEQAQSRNDKN